MDLLLVVREIRGHRVVFFFEREKLKTEDDGLVSPHPLRFVEQLPLLRWPQRTKKKKQLRRTIFLHPPLTVPIVPPHPPLTPPPFLSSSFIRVGRFFSFRRDDFLVGIAALEREKIKDDFEFDGSASLPSSPLIHRLT